MSAGDSEVFRICLASIILLSVTTVNAGWFGPSTFEECIDKYIVSAKTNYASDAVIMSCSLEFKKKKTDAKYKSYYKCIRQDVVKAQSEKSAKIMAYRCKSRAGL